MRTIITLPHIGGLRTQADADYLDTCRRKRNIVEYDYTGGATDNDADELIEFSHELQEDVIHWLHSNHPELIEAREHKILYVYMFKHINDESTPFGIKMVVWANAL